MKPTFCPECRQLKPVAAADLHDVVLMRKDWRPAQRATIEDRIPDAPMCLACFIQIEAEFAPLAPVFASPQPRSRRHF